MKRLKANIIIAGMLLLTAVLPLNASVNLRIMTFNVPQGNIPAVGLNTWANRARGIQAFLDSVKPDMMGMQEPVRGELVDLTVGMPNYAVLGVARDDGAETGEYSPIIYRTDRLLVEHTGTYWLSKTPDKVSKDWNSACRRIATWAVFKDKRTQARFLYTNTHLDHKSDSAREHQMEVLKTQLQAQIAQYGNMPMMITGDFNVYSTSTTYDRALNYLIPMKDAYTQGAPHSGPTWTWCSGGTKIDFIILSKDVTVDKTYIHESRLLTGQQLSDHNAHYADISWTTSQAQRSDSLVEVAKTLYDSTLKLNTVAGKLVTDAAAGSATCQLSSDGLSSSEGQYYKYAIDGNTDTYIHSQYSTPLPPNQPHYLQVDLQRSDVQAFTFEYTRRNHATYGPADRWQDVMVTASNDGKNWDYVTELYDFGGDAMQKYTSPSIKMWQPYRWVRFNVMHTPAQKLRNANPEFSLSEFQMFRDTIDETSSQRYYDSGVTAACDLLLQRISEAQTTQNATTWGNLREAVQGLRAVIIPNTLELKIDEAEKVYSTFTVGSSFGQSTTENREAFQNVIDSVKEVMGLRPSRSMVDRLSFVLDSAITAFKGTLKTFATDKWYYVTSRSLNGSVKAANFGNAIIGNATSSAGGMRFGGYIRYKLTIPNNPYAQWKICAVDEKAQTYALRNRATGFYMGVLNSDGSYAESTEPVPYKIDIYAVNDFHLLPAACEGKDSTYLTAATAGNSVVAGNGTANSNSSWTFESVAEDATLKYVEYPVLGNALQIVCLPFAVSGLDLINGNVKTYTINSFPAFNTMQLEEKEDFAAGEPFFLLLGDYSLYDASSPDSTYIQLPPPNEFVSEGLTENGVTGVLDQTRLTKSVFTVQDNVLKYGSSPLLNGQTGYVTRNKVSDTGKDIALTVTTGSITGVAQVIAEGNEAKVNVYGADGKLLRSGVSAAQALQNLPKGIYLIGKRKVLVP